MTTLRIDPREQRIVNRLRRALGLSDWIISTGFFGTVAQWALEYPRYLGRFDVLALNFTLVDVLRATRDFAVDKWAGIVLALVLYFWFRSYRHHASKEIGIIETLYPAEQQPHDWDRITNRRFIHFLAVGIVVAFMLMAALLNRPGFFAMVMVCMWCQDLFGNEIVRDNLRRIFVEHPLELPENDPRLPLFAARQTAARQYWLERPQLRRILAAMVLTVLALALAVLGQTEAPVPDTAGSDRKAIHTAVTLLLAGIILTNEVVVRRWRRERDDRLLDAEIEFARKDEERRAAEATDAVVPPSAS